LTRSAGPYARLRIGLASDLPACAMWAAARFPCQIRRGPVPFARPTGTGPAEQSAGESGGQGAARPCGAGCEGAMIQPRASAPRAPDSEIMQNWSAGLSARQVPPGLRSGRVGRRHAVAKRCLSSSVPPHAAMTESTTSKRAGSWSCSRSLQMVEATGPRSPHRLARSQNDGLSAHTRNCLSASMNSPGVLAVPESAGSWAERPFSRTPFVPACPATLYGARPRSGRCGPRARQGAAGARAVRCGR